jgi:hypothetical protein
MNRLKEEDVRFIRRAAEGLGGRVSQTINDIVKRRSWAHLADEGVPALEQEA